MKFSRETVRLIRRTINEKWMKILKKGKEELGSTDCILCHRFLRLKDSCDGCPIYYFTRIVECKNTPYKEWQKHQVVYHSEWGGRKKILCSTCREIAEKEIDFLEYIYKRSLLLMEV